MKLTETMELTKQERSHNIVLTIILGVALVFAAQIISILPTYGIENAGLKEVAILYLNIIVIAVIILFCRFFENRSLQSLGFKRKQIGKNLLFGALSGTAFIAVVFLVNLLNGAITVTFSLSTLSWTYIISAFVGYFFQGIMEELVCRGFIMNTIAAKANVPIAVLGNSLIFTLLHGLNDSISILAIVNLFLASLVLSLIFYLTDNLFFVGGMHAIWNFMLGPVFGVPVSGNSFYSSLFQTTLLPDRQGFNGGNFGFEGGLGLTIVAVLLLIGLIFRIKQSQQKN
ncbi:CPBP family intramembrane glutamic endopeptidase [Enterococcus sp. DIV0876]|uniref:CPBP family intramembrane glutamic endopeptidase n=1 Tax=Enterococcus sp. DIV0876 TaxID=2774633 RepID=UPI003D2FCD7D